MIILVGKTEEGMLAGSLLVLIVVDVNATDMRGTKKIRKEFTVEMGLR